MRPSSSTFSPTNVTVCILLALVAVLPDTLFFLLTVTSPFRSGRRSPNQVRVHTPAAIVTTTNTATTTTTTATGGRSSTYATIPEPCYDSAPPRPAIPTPAVTTISVSTVTKTAISTVTKSSVSTVTKSSVSTVTKSSVPTVTKSSVPTVTRPSTSTSVSTVTETSFAAVTETNSTPTPVVIMSAVGEKPPAAAPSATSWFQKQFTLPARARGSYLITREVVDALPELAQYRVGLLNLFVQHTSCALGLNENWDEEVREDMSDALDRIAPETGPRGEELYRHSAEGSDDMPAHIKSALIGASVTIPIKDGKLATGTWQGIWYLEFRASKHQRKVVATIQGEKAA